MANITRIKNNQITDQTIEYTKIKPGTLVGTVFNANITLNSNVTIVGNLDVSGTTTTVQSTNTYINDPLVIFNNGFASTPAYDIGILVNRNLTATAPYGSVNSAFVWQEAAKGFAGVMTTETGTTAGAINNSGYANLFIGNIYANTVTVRDTVDSTSKTTGAVLIAGGLGVAKTIYAESIQGTPIGTLVRNAGEFTTIITGGLQAQDLGNVTPGTGAFTTLSSNDQTSFTAGTDSTSIGTGAVILTGGLSVAKNISASSAVIGTLVTDNYSTANAVITGGYIDNTVIGSLTPNTAAFTTVTTTSTIISDGNIVANSGTTSTTRDTGALVVVGGAGIEGNVNAGGNTTLHRFAGNLIFGAGPRIASGATVEINQNTTEPFTSTSVLHISALEGTSGKITVDSVGNTAISSMFIARRARGTHATPVAVSSGDVLGGVIARGFGTTDFILNPIPESNGLIINAAEDFTDLAQGTISRLTVTPIGANLSITSIYMENNGNVVVPATTQSTSTTTGAFVVGGGIGVAKDAIIGGNAFVAGNLTVQGDLTYINTSTLTVEDALLELNTGSNGAPLSTVTTTDVGIHAHYYDTQDRSAFFGRASDTGYFEYHALSTEISGNMVGTHGTIKSGELWLANTTSASSSTTGALRVDGGAGIAGDAYVGGTLNVTGITTLDSTLNVNNPSYLNDTLTVTGISLFNSNVVLDAITESTNSTTGALVTIGGVGIGKQLNVDGKSWFNDITTHTANVVISSGVDASSTTTGALLITNGGGLNVAGNTFIGHNLYIGENALGLNLPAATIIAVEDGADFAQIALKNTASTGSTDFAAYSNDGDSDSGWADMGFTGSAFADANYTITKSNDGYFFVKPKSGSYGGNLVLGTSELGSYNDVLISVGSFYANAEVARFHGNATTDGYMTISTGTNATDTTNGALRVVGGMSVTQRGFFGGNLVAASTTNSTSATTGALVVSGNGGLGVTGNVFLGNAVTINSTKTAGQDFLVKGNTNETLIWARPNATYDQVLIGNSASVSDLVQGAKLQIHSTDSMLIPVGTNAQRPSSVGFTDVTGMLRYNTTLGYLEFYTGTDWDGVTTQFTVITDEQFTGDNSTVDFVLGGATTTASTIVSINGVIQVPTLAYSITGAGLDTLTFVEAPSSTDLIDVRRLTTTQTVTGIASTNGYMQFQVDNNGAYVYSGSNNTSVTTKWDTDGAVINKRANTTVATNSVATTIDSFFANTYSSAEYTVTATIQGTEIREIAKIIVVHDTSTAYRNVYGVISTSGNTLVTYTATVSSGSVLLQATTANDNTIFRIAKNYQAI